MYRATVSHQQLEVDNVLDMTRLFTGWNLAAGALAEIHMMLGQTKSPLAIEGLWAQINRLLRNKSGNAVVVTANHLIDQLRSAIIHSSMTYGAATLGRSYTPPPSLSARLTPALRARLRFSNLDRRVLIDAIVIDECTPVKEDILLAKTLLAHFGGPIYIYAPQRMHAALSRQCDNPEIIVVDILPGLKEKDGDSRHHTSRARSCHQSLMGLGEPGVSRP